MNDDFNDRLDIFSPFPHRSRETIRESINEFIDCPKRPFTRPPEKVNGHWLLYNSRWPYIRLDIEFDAPLLLSEAQDVLKAGEHHMQNGSFDWSTFSILDNRGFAINDSIDLLESLYDLEKFKFTEGCNESMAAWKLAQSLPLEKILGIQYYALQPGGIIIPHSDTVDQGLTRFNFSLSQPHQAYTYFENFGIIPYETGSCFIFDPSVKHAAVNDSETPRHYLQISGTFGNRTSSMYSLLEASFKKYYSSEKL